MHELDLNISTVSGFYTNLQHKQLLTACEEQLPVAWTMLQSDTTNITRATLIVMLVYDVDCYDPNDEKLQTQLRDLEDGLFYKHGHIIEHLEEVQHLHTINKNHSCF